MQHIDLETFANGALTAQVNRAIEEVTENIQDPNSKATAARKITVTLTFKPNENRDYTTTEFEVKKTLAPPAKVITAMSMGKDVKTGKVEAIEVIKGYFPGQLSFTEQNKEEPEMAKVADPSTGEIYETLASNIVDLRKAK